MYQGYSSYETWAASLWLSNDEPLYRHWDRRAEALVEMLGDPDYAAEALGKEMENDVEMSRPPIEDGAFADLVGYALENIDWKEVAAGFIEDYAPGYSYTGEEPVEKTHRGHANFPTYVIYSWVNGDYADDPEKIQGKIHRLVQKAAFEGAMEDPPLSTGFMLDTFLKETIIDAAPGPDLIGGFWSDLLSAEIGDVDWKELSDSLAEGYGLAGPKKPARLKKDRRQRLANEIAEFVQSKPIWDYIPLTDLFDILKRHGLTPIQEDRTEWSGILTGWDGKATFDLVETETWTDVDHLLVLTWHKFDTGRYEVVAYLS